MARDSRPTCPAYALSCAAAIEHHRQHARQRTEPASSPLQQEYNAIGHLQQQQQQRPRNGHPGEAVVRRRLRKRTPRDASQHSLFGPSSTGVDSSQVQPQQHLGDDVATQADRAMSINDSAGYEFAPLSENSEDGSDEDGVDGGGAVSAGDSSDDTYNPEDEPIFDCEIYGSILPECFTSAPTQMTNFETSPSTNAPTVLPTEAPTPLASDIGGSEASEDDAVVGGDGSGGDGPALPGDPTGPPPPPPKNRIKQKMSIALNYPKTDLMMKQKRFFHKLVRHTATKVLNDHSPFEVRLKDGKMAGIRTEDGTSSSSSSNDRGGGPPPSNGGGGGPPPNGGGGNGGGNGNNHPPNFRRLLDAFEERMHEQSQKPIVVIDVVESASTSTSQRTLQDSSSTSRGRDKVSKLKHFESRIWPHFDVEATRWWPNDDPTSTASGHYNTTKYHWYGVDLVYTVYWMNGKSMDMKRYLDDVANVCQAVLDYALTGGVLGDEWKNLHQYYISMGRDGFIPAADCNETKSNNTNAGAAETSDGVGTDANRTSQSAVAVSSESNPPQDTSRLNQNPVVILGFSILGEEMREVDRLSKPWQDTSNSEDGDSSSSSSDSNDQYGTSGRMFLSRLDTSDLWSEREWAGMGVLIGTLVLAVTTTATAAILQRRQLYNQTWQPFMTEDGIAQILDVGWRYQHGQGDSDDAREQQQHERQYANDQFFLQVYDKHNVGYSEDDSVLKGGPHWIHAAIGERDQGLAPTELPSSASSGAMPPHPSHDDYHNNHHQ